MIDLDELEKLARDATPGPWSIGTSSPLCVKTDVGVVIARVQLDDNCDYIAAANPATVVELIRQVRELQASCEEAWAKRRLYFHERNDEIKKRFALALDGLELAADAENFDRAWIAESRKLLG